MPRPPFNRQTPIGRAGNSQVSISVEFSRYLDQLVRLADGDAVDISGIEARVSVVEAKNTAQDGSIFANEAAILTNTNNIAGLLVNVSQLQSDMTAAQADILANAGALAALRDAPVRVITGEF